MSETTQKDPAVETLENALAMALGDVGGVQYHEEVIAGLREQLAKHEAKLEECRRAAASIQAALDILRHGGRID